MKLSKRFIGLVIFITLFVAIFVGGAYPMYKDAYDTRFKIDTRVAILKCHRFETMCVRMYACKVYDEYDILTGKFNDGKKIEDFKPQIDSLSNNIAHSCFDHLFIQYDEKSIVKRFNEFTTNHFNSKSDLYNYYTREISSGIMKGMYTIANGK